MGTNLPLPVWLAVFGSLAFGGLWWGEVAEGDDTLVRPLSAVTLSLAALAALAGELVFPQAKTAGWASDFFWLIPAFFFWASGPPLMSTLAFPGRPDQGLFGTSAVILISIGLGLALSSQLQDDNFLVGPIGIGSLAAFISSLGLIPWRPNPLAGLRLWPSRYLGLWSGEKIYGRELSVPFRLSRNVVPATFFGALAACSALVIGPWPEIGPWAAPVIIVILAALGALTIGPFLAAAVSPVTSLGLALVFLAFGAYPVSIGHQVADTLGWLRFGLPPMALGAIWPLAARIQLARGTLQTAALGRLNFWLLAGLAAGLIAASVEIDPISTFTTSASFPAQMALLGAFLAMVPSVGWGIGLILLSAATALFVWLQ
jgi:hypothetical protein